MHGSTLSMRAVARVIGHSATLIGVMVYSFARVGAAVTMRVGDFFQHRKRLWLRLHEKGGKRHEVPCRPTLEGQLNAYTRAAGIASDTKGRLFRSMNKSDRLTEKAMTRFDVFHMIKRRSKAAGPPTPPAATRLERLASPLTCKMVELSSMLRPSLITNRPGPLSSTIGLGRSFHSMRWKESRSDLSLSLGSRATRILASDRVARRASGRETQRIRYCAHLQIVHCN